MTIYSIQKLYYDIHNRKISVHSYILIDIDILRSSEILTKFHFFHNNVLILYLKYNFIEIVNCIYIFNNLF